MYSGKARCIKDSGGFFEEVKNDKIKLLYRYEYSVRNKDNTYTIQTGLNDINSIHISYKGRLKYEINWGEPYNTKLKDIQPLLDILNIEIIEEPIKYILDGNTECTEEQVKELEKLGLKFKIKESV